MASVQKPYEDPANIEWCERRYRQTENPIHAWEGWRIARKNGLTTPQWVAEYLDKCSTAVDQIARTFITSPTVIKLLAPQKLRSHRPTVDVAPALAKGFGFSRGRGYRSSFAEWATRNERELIGIEMAKRIAGGKSLSVAAVDVSVELDISDRTAQRAYRALGETGPRLVEALKSQAAGRDSSG